MPGHADVLGPILELMTWVGFVPGIPLLITGWIMAKRSCHWTSTTAEVFEAGRYKGFRWSDGTNTLHLSLYAPAEPRPRCGRPGRPPLRPVPPRPLESRTAPEGQPRPDRRMDPDRGGNHMHRGRVLPADALSQAQSATRKGGPATPTSSPSIRGTGLRRQPSSAFTSTTAMPPSPLPSLPAPWQ